MKTKKIKFLTLKSNQTIVQAIRKIDLHKEKTIFILDKLNDKFLGTITDGDIRRALIKGKSINNKVNEIYNKKYLSFNEKYEEIDAITAMKRKGIKIAPILNKSKKIIDVINIHENFIPTFKNLFVVMAGGKGKRLLPYTQNLPKPLVSVANKPILEHILLNARVENFKNILVSINYLGNKIKNYFKDGRALDLNINYLTEKTPLGTCGSLSLLKNKIKDDFVVCNGDLITNIKFSELLKTHIKNKADVTVAIKSHQIQNPYGVVKIKDKQIVDIIEKPFTDSFINVGAYVFKPTILKYLKKGKKIDMTDFLLLLKNKNKKIYACPLYEQWFDIGQPSDLEEIRVLKK
jgi:dTDP-glucose pyrophosphorylase